MLSTLPVSFVHGLLCLGLRLLSPLAHGGCDRVTSGSHFPHLRVQALSSGVCSKVHPTLQGSHSGAFHGQPHSAVHVSVPRPYGWHEISSSLTTPHASSNRMETITRLFCQSLSEVAHFLARSPQHSTPLLYQYK